VCLGWVLSSGSGGGVEFESLWLWAQGGSCSGRKVKKKTISEFNAHFVAPAHALRSDDFQMFGSSRCQPFKIMNFLRAVLVIHLLYSINMSIGVNANKNMLNSTVLTLTFKILQDI
jgi:ABC-type uncharacterized transport system permease subunit